MHLKTSLALTLAAVAFAWRKMLPNLQPRLLKPLLPS